VAPAAGLAAGGGVARSDRVGGGGGVGADGPGAGRGVALAVALGANCGGIATPIGTPPNTIVFMLLRREGHPINFVRWMLIGVPVAGVALAAASAGLLAIVRPDRTAGALAYRTGLIGAGTLMAVGSLAGLAGAVLARLVFV